MLQSTHRSFFAQLLYRGHSSRVEFLPPSFPRLLPFLLRFLSITSRATRALSTTQQLAPVSISRPQRSRNKGNSIRTELKELDRTSTSLGDGCGRVLQVEGMMERDSCLRALDLRGHLRLLRARERQSTAFFSATGSH